MKAYKTIDGIKRLQDIGGGLLHDPVSFNSYEARLVRQSTDRRPTRTLIVVRSGKTERTFDRLYYRKVHFYKNETEEEAILICKQKFPDWYDIK